MPRELRMNIIAVNDVLGCKTSTGLLAYLVSAPFLTEGFAKNCHTYTWIREIRPLRRLPPV